MIHYTDGKTVVEAEHRAGAFDKLQDYYLSSEIGDIYTASVVYNCCLEGRKNVVISDNGGDSYDYDLDEIKWIKEEDKP